MKINNIGSEILGQIKMICIGIIGLVAWWYGNKNSAEGFGIDFIKTFSIMIIAIGIIGIFLSKYFSKHPIKCIGVVNKDDEMLKLIRYKASHSALQVNVACLFIFIILNATKIITINISLYLAALILVVFMQILEIIFTCIYSNKMN